MSKEYSISKIKIFPVLIGMLFTVIFNITFAVLKRLRKLIEKQENASLRV